MNIFKLGLSFTRYMLYMTMNINEYIKMLGEFAYYSRALHVGKMTFNQHALRLRQD